MTYPNSLIDKRVITRSLQKGLVDRATLEKHIKALPDSEGNAERMEAAQESEEGDAVRHENI
ncbi:MAG: hypothetical protein H6715_00015 [Myxococcales bacterium]|nr:hypothetical protein [Myxococcales bacterium]MCB9707349.1 hypothetical protein [Myxococcales bacterium]